MVAHGVEKTLADSFSSVGQVESIFLLSRGETMRVVTVIGPEEEDAYDQLYSLEQSLIRQFRDVHFDFNVIARRGRPVLDIVGGDTAPIWQRPVLSDSASTPRASR